MTSIQFNVAVVLLLLFGVVFAGCTVTSDSPLPPPPPGDNKGDGMMAPPGGNQASSNYSLSGVYTVDGDTQSASDRTYTSDTTDQSAIYVTNGGTLTLNNPAIFTTGDTSSSDASSFYGLNGAILANNGSAVKVFGGSISTTGSGANGAIPTGTGTSITLSDLTITASGDGGHGVMATLGGSLTLTDVDITTTGIHGAPIATDRGSGTVNVTRGTIYSSGADSPGIYSTGLITIRDATIRSEGTEAAVIEGFNSIHLDNTTLSGGVEKTGGIMIYQSFSGDAETGTGVLTMNRGFYSSTAGPAFFITNTDANITLTGVTVTTGSDTLIKAAGTSRWGTAGRNGGFVSFTADGETLTGSLITDEISSIVANLKNGTSLTGAINTSSLSLDSTSTWIVTGDSHLTSLTDPDGISGDTITNIIGNGFTVTYDTDLPENYPLAGKTFSLKNGGTLRPQ
ncbi:MAG TPA: hypothetical protein VN372_02985 [Methanospirillum sp.]|nr:hypothetical protein [Methanospirillum sp.]